jgi:hypothetical protein
VERKGLAGGEKQSARAEVQWNASLLCLFCDSESTFHRAYLFLRDWEGGWGAEPGERYFAVDVNYAIAERAFPPTIGVPYCV